MTVGVITGWPVLHSGVRQPALGTLAVAVTWGIGHLVGAAAS